MILVHPSLLPLIQTRVNLNGIDKFTALGLRKAVLYFGGNPGAIIGQPWFVFMQHPNRQSDKFIGGLVGVPRLLE